MERTAAAARRASTRPLPNHRPNGEWAQPEHPLIHVPCFPDTRIRALETLSARRTASEVVKLPAERALHRAEGQRSVQRVDVQGQLKSPTSLEAATREGSASRHAKDRIAGYRGQAWDSAPDKADPRRAPRLAHQLTLEPHRGSHRRHRQQGQRHEREETRPAAHVTSYTPGHGSLNSRGPEATATHSRWGGVARKGLVRVRAGGR